MAAGVRRAATGDVDAVRSMRLAAMSGDPDEFDSDEARERARTPEDWRRWIEGAAVFLREDDGGAYAIAAGFPDPDRPGLAWLGSVWVRPDRRGRGAADPLVAAVLAWARAAGRDEVRLHVREGNERARALYARHGFRPTGETLRGPRGHLEVGMARIDVPRAG